MNTAGSILIKLAVSLTAIVILAVIVGFAAPRACACGKGPNLDDRRVLINMRTAIVKYASEHGALPVRLDELLPYYRGKQIPLDSWGQAFVYVPMTDGGFVVRSLGPDLMAGTEDDIIVDVPATHE